MHEDVMNIHFNTDFAEISKQRDEAKAVLEREMKNPSWTHIFVPKEEVDDYQLTTHIEKQNDGSLRVFVGKGRWY
jgi:hypothetical protein